MPKILGMSSGAKKEAKHGETQSYNFRAYHSFATLTAVSLLLSGMLMMWKIQQAKQEDVIWDTLLPGCFLPGNWGEVFIWQNFPACLPRSYWKNRDLGNGASAPSHMNTSEILLRT